MSQADTGTGAPFVQALDHFRHGRHEAATRVLVAALAAEPGNVALLNLAGSVARALGKPGQAETLWRSATVLKPDFFDAHYNLGKLLFTHRHFVEAERAFRRALELSPLNASVLNNIGGTLEGQDRIDEALHCYDRAIAIDPGYAMAHHNRGLVLNAQGRFDEAQQALETAVALASDKAPFYRGLAYSRRFSPGDPQLRAMEELAQGMEALSAGDRMQLHFALGKVYNDIGEHARSFDHFRAGNAAKRAQTAYNEAATLAHFGRIRAAFTPELMSARRAAVGAADVPIFILGMPRSGSSLVEQIIASHPQVHGVGECDDFQHLAEALRAADGRPLLPDAIAAFPEDALQKLGADYRTGLRLRAQRAGASSASHITDKTPGNFFHVGLIHLALPSARIIHTRRDPVDTCLSCFSQLFKGDHPCAYELGELGRYWCAYDELMAHWRRVLPAGVMLEIDYEELVREPEPNSRRLLDHCGLEWDAACLAFHRTQRPVRTASVTQVRQPIYRSSVRRWKAYGELLQPLLAALEPRRQWYNETP